MYVQGKSSEAADAIAAAVVKFNADPAVITQALAKTVSTLHTIQMLDVSHCMHTIHALCTYTYPYEPHL